MSDLRNRNNNKASTGTPPSSSNSKNKNGKTNTNTPTTTATDIDNKRNTPPSSSSSNKKVVSSTKAPVPVDPIPPKDDDEESYGGYQGSDDERAYDDYLAEQQEEDDNNPSNKEDGPVLSHDHRKIDRTPRPIAPIPIDDGDDNLVIIAALLGFFLCLGCGGILAYTGIQSELVMGGGMLGLLLFLVYLMMCPTCGRKRTGPMNMVEGVTPTAVFIIAGCIGIMLGAMFGGVYRNIAVYK